MINKILVVNGFNYKEAIINIAKEVSDDIALFFHKPEAFDLVLFTGGSDVSPNLYGHTSPKHLCGCNPYRDKEEQAIFDVALANNVPMTGICRGSQFLNVMCGGTMMHDIDNHALFNEHTIRVKAFKEVISVTSTHHQMCLPGKEGFIVGYAAPKRVTQFFGDEDKKVDYKGPEVEAIYYPNQKVFAVQYHPEYMDKNSLGYKWFEQGVKDLTTLQQNDFMKKYILEKTLEMV